MNNMFFNFTKKRITSLLILLIGCSYAQSQSIASSITYLDSIKQELSVKWPNNHTINLVFHGHSVPTGYGLSGVTDRLNAYPF